MHPCVQRTKQRAPEYDEGVVAARLGEWRRQQAEKAGKGQADRVDAAPVQVVVDQEGEQGAQHGADGFDEVDQSLNVVAPGEGTVGDCGKTTRQRRRRLE